MQEGSMATAEQTKERGIFPRILGSWLAWSLITTAGVTAAWVLAFWVEIFGPTYEELVYLWLLVGPIISWPVIGLCQLIMLRSRIKAKAAWVLLSGLAWIVTFVILVLVLSALMYGGNRRFSLHPALLASLSGILIGSIFGFLQWSVLRRSVASAGAWIAASIAGWVLCLLLIQFLGQLPLPLQDQPKIRFLVIVGASMVGMVTGIGYVWLFHPPARRIPFMAALGAFPLVFALGLGLSLTTSYSQQSKILRSTHGLANVLDISFSADGRMLAAVTNTATENSEYRGLVVWDMNSGKEIHSLKAEGDYVAFLPDGKQVVTAGHLSNPVTIWDLASGKELVTIPEQANDIAVSPDGKLLAIGTGNYQGGELILWDLDAGQALKRWKAGLEIYEVAFSPDSKFLAMGMGHLTQRYVRIWDIELGRPGFIIPDLPSISSLAFSPDGERVMFGAGRILQTWDIDREMQLGTLYVGDQIGHIALSPDGQWVALAYGQLQRGPSILLYDVSSGQLVDTLIGHTQPITGLAFSPDGRTLASSSWDGTARLWAMEE
jgi:heme/copper-type cytochrome/quinol oxidase subunit 2